MPLLKKMEMERKYALSKMTGMSFWPQLDFDGLRTMDEIAPVYWAFSLIWGVYENIKQGKYGYFL